MLCVILGMQTDLSLTQLTLLLVWGSGLPSAKLGFNWKRRLELTVFVFCLLITGSRTLIQFSLQAMEGIDYVSVSDGEVLIGGRLPEAVDKAVFAYCWCPLVKRDLHLSIISTLNPKPLVLETYTCSQLSKLTAPPLRSDAFSLSFAVDEN